ncbi:NepR family anti-sigma factor [Ciceribacter ferrooxidans]|uniref:Anti-sigma factor NepR domain-containing protein n=1 Tax=Ciceribacter ferrooxidans TaxID=2509717 RepID=A0A4Q2SAH0_9HYPH|nr:NepR family anti-sigma factor [Ciceribacter ferrooxidans]RYB97903.1 hypothetical protein EUU22_22680 [Ciceribacter ferrooxidans]HLP67435.1 NepR family anti-sigma factor [Rhizobium sp.]
MTRFTDRAYNGAGGEPAAPPYQGIISRLRQFYQSVQDEGIPDKFLELLERLDAAEKNAAGQRVTGDNA